MAASIPVRVVSVADLSTKVVGIRLAPTGSACLPAFQPGAHIELQIPNGLKRSYSLTSSPSDTSHYDIAVGRSAASRGGSDYLCDALCEGEVMLVSQPRNDFRLSETARAHVFVAGGIGLTPFVSMAERARTLGHEVQVHLAVRRASDAPPALLEMLQGHGHVHVSEEGKRLKLTELLRMPQQGLDATAYYFCGPQTMLNEARVLTQDWPAGRARFESFAPGPVGKVAAGEAFTVQVAKDGRSFAVGTHQTLLEKLREEGYAIGSSCEHGTCGTCRVRHVAGQVVHHDAVLGAEERQLWLTTCVSRGRGVLRIEL